MVDGLTNQNQITGLNVYAIHDRASKYTKQKFIEYKEKHKNHDRRYQYFSSNNCSEKKRENIKGAEDLNNTINQFNQSDIYKTSPFTSAEYISFLGSHEMCTKIDRILGHKMSFDVSQRIEVIKKRCSDHNGINLRCNNKDIWEIT